MAHDSQPTIDDLLDWSRTAIERGNYGIIKISPRRYAVVKRSVQLQKARVGYGKAEKRPGRVLGYDLSGPLYLIDWVEYEIVQGLERMDYTGALRALYDLSVEDEIVRS